MANSTLIEAELTDVQDLVSSLFITTTSRGQRFQNSTLLNKAGKI